MTRRLEEELTACRARLRRVIVRRMDPRVRARFDVSDVLQETFLEAYGRQVERRESRQLSYSTWMRLLAEQKLIQPHRRHLGAAARDARREVAPPRAEAGGAGPTALSSLCDASELSPSRLAVQEERRLHVRAALTRLDASDREILELRHAEQLRNGEAAARLRISEQAASMRYVRALARLRAALRSSGGDISR